jgi:soluble lytic murein transglycosylase-like protein
VRAELSWTEIAELELRFARSRRRVELRRSERVHGSQFGRRTFRTVLLAVLLLAVVAESTPVESSSANPPVRRASTLGPVPSCPVPARFRAAFVAAAAKTGVPLSLLVATAYEESRMNPAARSRAGASGLLQVMPATARALRLGGGSPRENVLAGARYLRALLDRFGSVELALAAYNAGPTAVERAGGAPTLETLRYAKNVEVRTGHLFGCR